ncbi:MAG: hypothetical protein AAFX03_11925 [Pseudomonadota bacterium]
MKRHLITHAGFAAAVSFAIAGAAHAGSPADYFERMDADANGAVTLAEYTAYKTAKGKSAEDAAAYFNKVAGDDAQLTLAELETAMQSHRAGHEKKTDADRSS